MGRLRSGSVRSLRSVDGAWHVQIRALSSISQLGGRRADQRQLRSIYFISGGRLASCRRAQVLTKIACGLQCGARVAAGLTSLGTETSSTRGTVSHLTIGTRLWDIRASVSFPLNGYSTKRAIVKVAHNCHLWSTMPEVGMEQRTSSSTR